MIGERRAHWWLFGALAMAAFMRLFALERGDAVLDEVDYAFRAIGLVDTHLNPIQTTPLEWFDPETPWWTGLSFHDGPPLALWMQHFAMQLFGESRAAFRLPSALLGIGCVYLLYDLGRLVYSERVGLIAAALLAVSVNHIYISRVGMLEIYVVFFGLLFLRFVVTALEKEGQLIPAGVALGLGGLAKYLSAFTVPIAIALIAIRKPSYFRGWRLWLGVASAALVMAPVLVYNFEMYRAVGHFDFQLSYMLGQESKAWTIFTGKEIVGDFGVRAVRFLPALLDSHSWVFLCAVAASIGAFFVSLARDPRSALKLHLLLVLTIIVLVSLVLRVGSTYRFVALLTPYLVLCVAVLLARVRGRAQIVLLSLLMAFESLYAYNSSIAFDARGWRGVSYAHGPRSEAYNHGYNELDDYLTAELSGKRPAQSLDMEFAFLDRVRDEARLAQADAGLEPLSAIVIYDASVGSQARTWSVLRWQIYHGWPELTSRDYLDFITRMGIADITDAGFDRYYFILPVEPVPRTSAELSKSGVRIERVLRERGVEAISIRAPSGREAFRVYAVDATSGAVGGASRDRRKRPI